MNKATKSYINYPEKKSFLPGAEILPVEKESDNEDDDMETDEKKVEQDGEWVDVAHDPEADLDEDDIKVKLWSFIF